MAPLQRVLDGIDHRVINLFPLRAPGCVCIPVLPNVHTPFVTNYCGEHVQTLSLEQMAL